MPRCRPVHDHDGWLALYYATTTRIRGISLWIPWFYLVNLIFVHISVHLCLQLWLWLSPYIGFILILRV